jgi:hypothetical protein
MNNIKYVLISLVFLFITGNVSASWIHDFGIPTSAPWTLNFEYNCPSNRVFGLLYPDQQYLYDAYGVGYGEICDATWRWVHKTYQAIPYFPSGINMMLGDDNSGQVGFRSFSLSYPATPTPTHAPVQYAMNTNVATATGGLIGSLVSTMIGMIPIAIGIVGAMVVTLFGLKWLIGFARSFIGGKKGNKKSKKKRGKHK